MVENATQIKIGIKKNVDASVKTQNKIMYEKKNILLHVLVKMVNIYEVLLTIQ